ncbi:hypothetical protein EJB05_00902 [Eragrostis curvula]|uniref:Uncharacterized protein n=1 Tax=Eragrostis curvula TaxID=38414 RepID=A0A5J9WNV4_9POAL|nr:hypothetical protein EJB05_00902 [Eragrostis curvula]
MTMASLSLTAVATNAASPSIIVGRRRRLTRVAAMAAPKPKSKTTAGTTRRSGTTTVFPVGEPVGPRPATTSGGKAKAPVKLLTNVERLRLLTKAERAGLLSAAERAGLSLSAVERLGLLSKAEELGALSAAADPATPGALLSLAAPLLAAGPAVAYLVPEEHAWQVALQAAVALVSVVGGAAAVAASSFVSRLQGSSSS